MEKVQNIRLADAYALLALIFGAFLAAATPPFGVGDETAHFERSYEIAVGKFLGAPGIPAGMQALIDDAFGMVKTGEAVGADDHARWASIPLRADELTPYPEPIRAVLRLHSPLCYIHFAPIAATGLALGLPPLAIFHLQRATALLIGIFLVRAALLRAPAALRPPLAFIALLPTTIVFFAGLNIESLLVGLGFYFFALIASLAAEPEKPLSRGDVIKLIGVAFLLGQFKTAYLLLPALAVILPATKFPGWRARIIILVLIILPGAAASLAWAMTVKNSMLAGLVYSTMDGNRVEPAAQLAGVLADPVGYLGVLWRTMFASDSPDFAWKSFLALGGWTNIAVPGIFYALLTIALFLVWLSGEKPPAALTTPFASLVQSGLFIATALAILTLVYFQWNGVGDPVVTGFQGRYLFAATPLLAALAPVRLSLMAAPYRREALAFGAPTLSLIAMAVAIIGRYY